jgi:hypothetical protein
MINAGTMALDMLRGLGWTVPVGVLLPNILWAILPGPASPEPPTTIQPPWLQWLRPVEWLGRAAVLALPLFYEFKLVGAVDMLAGCLMLLALAFYYIAWVRFFMRGRTPLLLYQPLLGVPLPLALSPVVFFLAAAVSLHAVPLAIATILFGVAHVAVSGFEYERLVRSSGAR